jgi:hypothetical protein
MRTDGQSDMKKVIVAFRKFTNAPKNAYAVDVARLPPSYIRHFGLAYCILSYETLSHPTYATDCLCRTGHVFCH